MAGTGVCWVSMTLAPPVSRRGQGSGVGDDQRRFIDTIGGVVLRTFADCRDDRLDRPAVGCQLHEVWSLASDGTVGSRPGELRTSVEERSASPTRVHAISEILPDYHLTVDEVRRRLGGLLTATLVVVLVSMARKRYLAGPRADS